MACSPQKLRVRHGMDGTLAPTEGTDPGNTDFRLWPPELREHLNFCCLKHPSLWYFVMQPLDINTQALVWNKGSVFVE